MTYTSILITGASSGIGEELAKTYAANGVHLTITGRNKDRLNHVADECRARGASVVSDILDVTDRRGIAEFMEDIDNAHQLDLVIANAGVSGGTGSSDGDVKTYELPEQCRYIFDVNLTGVLNTLEPIIPKMVKRGHGHVALMSSLAGYRGWPGAPSYSAAKGAIRLYGDALRSSLKPFGVNVTNICPGFVKSRMTDANSFSMPFLMDTDKAAKIIINGIQKNKRNICFPWQTTLIAKTIGILPPWVVYPLLERLPAKGELNEK